jgi:hypothetical protein
MPVASLHGVTLAWSLGGLRFDPLADLLGMLEVDVDTGLLSQGSTVRIELRPAPPSAAGDPRDEGWEPSFFHGVVQAYRGAGGFLIWDHASRVIIAPGGAPVLADVAPPEREVVPGSTGAVLQIALALALRPAGLFHLHAAALVLPSGVPVIVAGGSGAGKTTTTLALLEAGADYLGDDTLFLHAPAPGSGAAVDVIAFPREFHLGPTTLAAFPRLGPLAGPPSARGDKRPLDPRRAYPGRHRPSVAVRPLEADGGAGAIALFPSIAAAPVTTLAPIARADAFGHLLASSASLVIDGADGRDENVALLGALLGAARCHEIRLGADAIGDPRGAIASRIGALRARA